MFLAQSGSLPGAEEGARGGLRTPRIKSQLCHARGQIHFGGVSFPLGSHFSLCNIVGVEFMISNDLTRAPIQLLIGLYSFSKNPLGESSTTGCKTPGHPPCAECCADRLDTWTPRVSGKWQVESRTTVSPVQAPRSPRTDTERRERRGRTYVAEHTRPENASNGKWNSMQANSIRIYWTTCKAAVPFRKQMKRGAF